MSEDIKTSKGKLFIVSTPIGNKDDFTVRAMNSLKRCDFVICEEIKVGARTLKQLNLSKDLIPLNEHNEVEQTNEILDRIIKGEKACLISDDGTPLIADPGNHFIKQALYRNIEIEVVPGVTSILTALVRSGFATDQFVFAGFVGRKTEEKFQDVRDLSREKRTVVLLETPYRLASTLEVLAKIMPNRRAYIGMNLTHPYETHHYGTFEELYNKLKDLEIKAEFVICFEGSTFTNFHKKDDFTQEKSFNRDDFTSSPRRDEDGNYSRERSSGGRDNRDSRGGGFNRDNRSGGDGYNKDRRSGGRDNRGSYNRDRNSEGGERREGFSRDNRDWDKGKDNFSRDGGFKRKEFSGDREGGFKKKEFGSRDGGFKKREFSGDRRDSFKRKEYGDDKRKSFDKPKSFNFSDDDFEKSGPFSNDWDNSSERRSDRSSGDRRDFKRGDRKDSKFGSKSGGKFGGSKSGGSKSGGSRSGSSKSVGKFAASKFGKRSGGSKGKK